MKKIIHIDMDCFYAQVEMRDNPYLKDKPIAVGGLPGTRSVLCTSNYLARTFGVKSAMPTDYAVKLCPELIVLAPNFKKYQLASELIQSIFLQYSKLVEPVSLDEAYIDVSHSENATEIAIEIKKKIYDRTGLTASVGVAPNKFLAKIASDWKKPNGLFVIPPQHIDQFVKILPVKLIPGIGKKGQEILSKLGVSICDDFQKIPYDVLVQYFGKFSTSLYQYSKGIDEREVVSEWERKSLSVESTFGEDINDINNLSVELLTLKEEMINRIEAHFDDEGEKKLKKVFVKVKFNDFSKTSCEETLNIPTTIHWKNLLDSELFLKLLKHCVQKKSNAVRLIGVGVRFTTKEDFDPVQLSLLPFCGSIYANI